MAGSFGHFGVREPLFANLLKGWLTVKRLLALVIMAGFLATVGLGCGGDTGSKKAGSSSAPSSAKAVTGKKM